MDKKFVVNCIQISGKNNLVFNGGEKVSESQLNEPVKDLIEKGYILPEKDYSKSQKESKEESEKKAKKETEAKAETKKESEKKSEK